MWSSFSVTVILEDPSDSSWMGTLSPPHLPLQWRTCSKYRVPGSVDSVWRATTQTNMLYISPVRWSGWRCVRCSVRFFSILLWRGLIFTCCVDRESVYCFIIMFIDIILSIKGKKTITERTWILQNTRTFYNLLFYYEFTCFCHKARKKLNFRGSREDIFIY